MRYSKVLQSVLTFDDSIFKGFDLVAYENAMQLLTLEPRSSMRLRGASIGHPVSLYTLDWVTPDEEVPLLVKVDLNTRKVRVV